MAIHSVLNTFYASQTWINFRATVIADRGLVCQECKKLIAKERDAHVHHITELTIRNVHDAMIALNPDNVLVLHKACHDKIHDRFGSRKPKAVYIVYGMPGSGKTTYVAERKGRNDIVLDMDQLYKAVTLLPDYDKPDRLLSVVRGVYNHLLDMVKTRNGKWQTAWVIGGFPDKYQREKLAEDLGAELVYIECTREEAIRRISLDEHRINLINDYTRYIETWINRYTP